MGTHICQKMGMGRVIVTMGMRMAVSKFPSVKRVFRAAGIGKAPYEPGARFSKNLRKNPKFSVSFS